MKFFIIAFAIVAVIAAVNAANIDIPDAFKEKAKQYVAECRTQHVFPDDEYDRIMAGEIFEASDTAKCFTNCFQEKAGILKDGVFQEEAVLTKFSGSIGEDKAKSIVEACRGQTGNGNCDIAYNYHQCYKKNNA